MTVSSINSSVIPVKTVVYLFLLRANPIYHEGLFLPRAIMRTGVLVPAEGHDR